MSDSPHNPAMDFDWVTARSQCSATEQFLALREHARADVETANQVFRESRRQFGFRIEKRSFLVFEQSADYPRAITFELSDSNSAIVVKNEDDTEMFRVTLSLNKERRCVFLWNGEEMESWEVRRKALEAFFYTVKVPGHSGFKGV